MNYRITNPSSPWRTPIGGPDDVEAITLPNDQGDPRAVGLVLHLEAVPVSSVEVEGDERPTADELKCRLSRVKARKLLDDLRRVLDEGDSRFAQDLPTPE